MRRRAGAILLLASVLLFALGVAAAGSDDEILHRAEASATAIHGFYDHEDLVPVALLNLSVPHARASLEPGPASEALGSFLWDPEAAELGTILCVLSEGQFCDLPDYPFVARATHPSAGDEDPPPGLALDDPASPVLVRAAHQEAEAGPEGAAASGSVNRLAAVPMTPPQARAAASLSAALAAAGAPADAGPWLVRVTTGVSDAAVTSSDGAMAAAESRIEGLELLGGLITARVVHGRAEAEMGEEAPRGEAEAVVKGLRVGDLRAEVRGTGIRIVDREVGGDALAPLHDALDGALEAAGIALGPGRERVRTTDGVVEAEAFAFSLDLRRENLPDQFPEGTKGADVVRVAVGSAAASVAEARVGFPPVTGGGGGAPPLGAPPAPGALPGGGLQPAADVPPAEPSASEVASETLPAVALSNLGVPLRSVALVAAGALALVLGLAWLRVNEALTE